MIHYYDIEIDYRPFLQVTHNDYAQMDRAFLLYILGAYLFANGGQEMSWRWLSLFFDFEGVREANQGQACLAYLQSSLDTLSRRTLRQLVGPLCGHKRSFWSRHLVFAMVQESYIYIQCPFQGRTFDFTIRVWVRSLSTLLGRCQAPKIAQP